MAAIPGKARLSGTGKPASKSKIPRAKSQRNKNKKGSVPLYFPVMIRVRSKRLLLRPLFYVFWLSGQKCGLYLRVVPVCGSYATRSTRGFKRLRVAAVSG
ncbi:hypothetical protein FMZ60_15390 [Alcaligenaceae bacterium SJ-26]|nr:hypothetical protein FMZ60_15390 [Alcaligenaceae bacterium SJ-26]